MVLLAPPPNKSATPTRPNWAPNDGSYVWLNWIKPEIAIVCWGSNSRRVPETKIEITINTASGEGVELNG